MRRLFLALDLSSDVRRELALAVSWMGSFDETLSITPPENYHVTLKFLGPVPENQIRSIEALMARQATLIRPCRLEIGAWGVFPEIGHPAVFWAGVEPGDLVYRMYERCEKTMDGLGFLPERRPFHPHITLARTTRQAHAPHEFLFRWRALAPMALPPFQVSSITLYESVAGSDVNQYIPISSFALDGHPVP